MEGPDLLFTVGKVKLTKRVLEHSNIGVPDLVDAFERYIHGDWGEVSGVHGLANDLALTSGEQIAGVYKLFDGTAFVMSTRAGVTTVQLPDEWEPSVSRQSAMRADG